ncbi:spermidine synthase [Caminibacter pacificus]|jgi:spermidine synthase
MSIKNEMTALVGGCTSEGTKILVPQNLKDEFKKITITTFDIHTQDDSNGYDLIIEETPGDLIKAYEKLNDKGIYITTPKSLTDRDLFASLSKLYWIVLPFYYLDENLNAKPLVFASKKFHPTADIIRHRSDFVENTKYYTTDVHIAAFTLPKYIFEQIKDVIKL